MMPRPASFTADAALAAAAILEASQPIATPPSAKSPPLAHVIFTSSPNATPVPITHKLPAAAPDHRDVGTQPPLSTSLPHHPNRSMIPSPKSQPTVSTPTPAPYPAATPARSNRLPFTPPVGPLETPSAIFGTLAAPTTTPFAATTPATTRALLSAAIPLTFSAANTPLPQPRDETNANATPFTLFRQQHQPTPPTPAAQPNPSVVKSFFRQRSAHLSSPIFRPLRQRYHADLDQPVVVATPIGDTKDSCPPSIPAVLERRIAFSLKDGFKDQGPLVIDLGYRAARVPLLHALSFTFVDEDDGCIRPLSIRLDRDLDDKASMFVSVLRSELAVPGTETNSDDETELLDMNAVRTHLATEPLTFWAAPETEVENGTARFLLSVTDADYGFYELPIEIRCNPVPAKVSVQGPNEIIRSVDNAETSVFFGEDNDFTDKIITIWNETPENAPVLLNVVVEDSASGSFTVSHPQALPVDCVPLLIPGGQKTTFMVRFALQKDITIRKMFYGSVLVKLAAVYPKTEAPGKDMELDQFYDIVVNLKAGIPDSSNSNVAEQEWEGAARKLVLHEDTQCGCSENGDALESTSPVNQSYELPEDLLRFSLQLDEVPDPGQVVPFVPEDDIDESAVYNFETAPQWIGTTTSSKSIDNGATALDILSNAAASQLNLGSSSNKGVNASSGGDEVGVHSSSLKPPKIRLPRSVREHGINLGAAEGTVELRMQNGSDVMVEVSARTRSQKAVTVSPNYLVIKAGEKSTLTLVRETADAADEIVILVCSTMTEPRLTTIYEVPMTVMAAVVRLKQQPDPVSVDRPTVSFYNPCDSLRDSCVRILNGTSRRSDFRVWVGGDKGPVLNDAGNPVFSIIQGGSGVIRPDEIVNVQVRFDGGDFAAHYTDTLHISVGRQYDVMSLFGYSGSCDMQFSSTADGYVRVQNDGDRCGFVLITGPECDEDSERAVLRPGEQVELPAVHGSGSVIYTGDEIARSRARHANTLFGRDDGDSGGGGGGYAHDNDCVGNSFTGHYSGEDEAEVVEGYVWDHEDRHSLHYAGRLLDGNVRKFVFDLEVDHGVRFVEERHIVGHGWTACVDNDDGFVHIENTHVDRELEFEVLGAEPRRGVVPPLGDAKVAAFRENVEVRAGGTVQYVTVDLTSCESGRRQQQ